MAELNDAMTLPEILDQLADIEVPPPVSYAPETVGWAVLAVVLAAFSLTIAVWIRRRRQANRYRHVALGELELLEQANEQTPDALVGEIAALVKRTALSVYPRQDIAPLHGAAWGEFLQAHSKVSAGQGLDALMYGSYQPGFNHTADALVTARQWITTHRV